MKYLSPQIALMAKQNSTKSLFKKGISCGIFQELGENPGKDSLYLHKNNK